jgi:cytochrome c biogenesis protein CcmG/thiol:disulfide interchange protein DsbE
MAKRSKLIFVPPAVFGLLIGLFFAGMYRNDPDSLPSTLVGRDAPVLNVTPLADLALLDADVLRQPGVKLVNFWASWCPPCRAEHPLLEELAASGIPVHGVNYKDDPANAMGFLAELGNPYTTMGADTTGRTAIEWGVYGVPETYVIDAQGKVVHRLAGPVTRQELERTLMPAIERARGN